MSGRGGGGVNRNVRVKAATTTVHEDAWSEGLPEAVFVCDLVDCLASVYEGIGGLERRQWACHDFILRDMSVQEKETNACTYLTWHPLQTVRLHFDPRLLESVRYLFKNNALSGAGSKPYGKGPVVNADRLDGVG